MKHIVEKSIFIGLMLFCRTIYPDCSIHGVDDCTWFKNQTSITVSDKKGSYTLRPDMDVIVSAFGCPHTDFGVAASCGSSGSLAYGHEDWSHVHHDYHDNQLHVHDSIGGRIFKRHIANFAWNNYGHTTPLLITSGWPKRNWAPIHVQNDASNPIRVLLTRGPGVYACTGDMFGMPYACDWAHEIQPGKGEWLIGKYGQKHTVHVWDILEGYYVPRSVKSSKTPHCKSAEGIHMDRVFRVTSSCPASKFSVQQLCDELYQGGGALKPLPGELDSGLKPLYNLPEQFDAAKPKIVSSILQIVNALKQVSQQKASLASQTKELKSYGLTSVGTEVSQALGSLEQALQALAQVNTQKIDKAVWAQEQFREENRPMTAGPQPAISDAALWNEEFEKLIGQPGVCEKGVLCGYLDTISSSSANARKTLTTIKAQEGALESQLEHKYKCAGHKSNTLATYMLELSRSIYCKR